ncbi:BrnT family toxin [Halomonas sp. CH40]
MNGFRHHYTLILFNLDLTPFVTRLIADPDHSEEENRFILLGTSIHSRLLVVCHCVRDGEIIRIISARKANKREQNTYEGYRHA